MSSGSSVYVFCAIRENKSTHFGKVVLNGINSNVYTIHHQDIGMVVSKVEGEVLPERNNLFAHQQTILKVMKNYSLIPFSFGNVFSSEKDVLLIAKHLKDEFESLFSQLENKIEVGLRVIAKKNWMDEEMKNHPVLNEWKTNEKDLSDPGSFYEQIQLGELAERFVLELQERIEREVYKPLLELAEAGKRNNTIPGKTLLNASYLVDLSREEDFDQRVNDLYEVWKDKVEFKYTGPWPAYNFVNIRLRIEG